MADPETNAPDDGPDGSGLSAQDDSTTPVSGLCEGDTFDGQEFSEAIAGAISADQASHLPQAISDHLDSDPGNYGGQDYDSSPPMACAGGDGTTPSDGGLDTMSSDGDE